MAEARSFDPIWEEKYAAGHAQRYPWDAVVSFVFRHAPRDRPRSDVKILEVGCGTASNLWFAAREGFSVAGVDASASAIRNAEERFRAEKLAADLRVADFTALPFDAAQFDLAIDRAAITCAGRSAAALAVGEVHRVLRPSGLFYCNLYSDRHTSHAEGKRGPDGVTVDIAGGSLVGAGQICFYDHDQVLALFARRAWEIAACQHLELRDAAGARDVHGEWRVIARRAA